MAGTLETLLHFDGTNGSTTFTDATGKHTWTSDSTAALDTSQSKFGPSSVQIGQGGAWGRVLGDGTINWGNAAPFTVDFWLKLNGTQPGQINIFDLTNSSILLYIPTPGAPLNFYAGGVAIAGVTNVTLNVWHHVALTFDGTTQYLFLDGHLEGTWVNASVYGVSSALFPLFGQGGGYSPVGWVDEARILLGGCDWTASFTPPTAPYADPAIPSGALATTEAKDVVAFAGTVALPAVSGTLATTEAKDAVAFAGTAAAPGVSGTLATTEAQDVAHFVGTAGVAGTLATTEAKDAVAFAGPGAIVSGTLATTEAKDAVAFAGPGAVISGTWATIEATDIVAFAGPGGIVSGTWATIEAKDMAAFVGAGVVRAATNSPALMIGV